MGQILPTTPHDSNNYLRRLTEPHTFTKSQGASADLDRNTDSTGGACHFLRDRKKEGRAEKAIFDEALP